MRNELKKFTNQKVNVRAEFERYGLKNQYIGGQLITMLLKNVEIQSGESKTKTEHLWINVGKTLEEKNIVEGTTIEFSAWVKPYEKGYVNHREFIDERHEDIGIQRVSKINVIQNGEGVDFKSFVRTKLKTGGFISNKYKAVTNH